MQTIHKKILIGIEAVIVLVLMLMVVVYGQIVWNQTKTTRLTEVIQNDDVPQDDVSQSEAVSAEKERRMDVLDTLETKWVEDTEPVDTETNIVTPDEENLYQTDEYKARVDFLRSL